MHNHMMIAGFLAFAAVMDVVMAVWVVGPKLPEDKRGGVVKALLAGACVMMGLAVAIGGQFITLG
ncbi:MAG: hypothetical protein AB7F75_11385 [Planctomycetota bacterium]